MSLDSLFEIRNKVAIVTGGSRGIGKMIARGFVEAGVRTYITSRSEADCDDAARELGVHGECIAMPFDLSEMDEIKAFVAAFRAREPELHILVNNAGTAWGAPLEDFPENGWDKVMSLNVKTPFFLIKELMRELKTAGSADDPARIINISSIEALVNSHQQSYSYSVSKAGISRLTKHLSADLVKDNINVNAIAPGYFMTKMIAHREEDEYSLLVPCGRTGKSEDIVGTAIFLSSRAGAYITGVTLPLDGGIVAYS